MLNRFCYVFALLPLFALVSCSTQLRFAHSGNSSVSKLLTQQQLPHEVKTPVQNILPEITENEPSNNRISTDRWTKPDIIHSEKTHFKSFRMKIADRLIAQNTIIEKLSAEPRKAIPFHKPTASKTLFGTILSTILFILVGLIITTLIIVILKQIGLSSDLAITLGIGALLVFTLIYIYLTASPIE